jgi:formate dehydrogenase assembly factor FdhD
MKDYCRHVARGVLVGSAFRNGKPENAFFTLTAS